MDVIANNIHHAADVTDVEKVTLGRVVVRPLPWYVFMDFFCKNDVGPQPYPIEGIGNLTVVVVA